MQQIGKTSLLTPNYIPLHLRQIKFQFLIVVVRAEPLSKILEYVKRVL